jgi:hypothetical protein
MSEIDENGCLPDFDGKPILASCENCDSCMDDSDGWEYGPPYYICADPVNSFKGNLKSFPFKTPQKCCVLHHAHTTDWDAIAKEQGFY